MKWRKSSVTRHVCYKPWLVTKSHKIMGMGLFFSFACTSHCVCVWGVPLLAGGLTFYINLRQYSIWKSELNSCTYTGWEVLPRNNSNSLVGICWSALLSHCPLQWKQQVWLGKIKCVMSEKNILSPQSSWHLDWWKKLLSKTISFTFKEVLIESQWSVLTCELRSSLAYKIFTQK